MDDSAAELSIELMSLVKTQSLTLTKALLLCFFFFFPRFVFFYCDVYGSFTKMIKMWTFIQLL